MLPRHSSGYPCVVGRLLLSCTFGLVIPTAATAATISVPSGASLQSAINAAQPGDVIQLEPGAIYTGNFVLPVKTGSTDITIRTAPDPRLPSPGERIDPALHAPLLAKLQSPNSGPALQTVGAAHHWRIELLEFRANASGYAEIIRLGRGGTEQTTLDVIPHNLTFDRCFIHGDPLLGQKRGIALNSASTTIRNSYISDIKGVGLDTQTIAGWNGPGPYAIENNYLEAAGENVLFGGADPKVPNLVPGDITFRLNHLSKDRRWRQPIIPTPSSVTMAIVPGGGTLAAGTYTYQVVARRHVGLGTIGGSLPSAPVSASLTDAGAVRVSWPAVEHATEYRVYRRSGTTSQYWRVTDTSFTDTGASGTAGTPPTDASRWTVKNIFELKNARRVLVEGNVLENNWAAGQGGVGIVLTPRNQDGTAPWSVVSDVTIRYNLVRHVGGGMSANGFDTNHPSQQGRNIRVEHNVFEDVNANDGAGRFLIMGNQPAAIAIDHNTILQTDTILLVYGKNADGTFDVVDDFHFTNNLTLHNTWGIVGENGNGLGIPSILSYFGTLDSVQRNVLAGGAASKYPAGNFFPDVATFMAGFADSSHRLRPDSPYRNAGTDGKDLGADIDTVMLLTQRALAGSAAANQPPTAVPGGPYVGATLDAVAFDGAASDDPDGIVVSYVWSWSDGCSDTSGPAVTHTFPRSGVYTATLTVIDDRGLSAAAQTSVTIVNRPPTAVAGGPYAATANATLAVSGAASADTDGSISSYRWNWGDGSADVSGATPQATHVYAKAGEYQITLTVTDDEGSTATSTTTARIAGVSPAIAVSATSVAAGSLVTATLTDAPGGEGDWLALAAASAPNTSYLQFTYVGTGVKTRAWTVAMPSTPGVYQFRLFANNGYTRIVTSADITVLPGPPVLTSLSPAGAAPGSPAFTLTANGSGFTSASGVRWNGLARATTFVSATQLRASISSADVASAGTAQVTVHTPSDTGSVTSAPLPFVIGAPTLQVSTTTANIGDSVMVTLTSGLGGAKDWLAFAATGAPNNSYVQYTYVGSGVTTRTWVVTLPPTAGTYEFRLFLNDGYTLMATSAAITVQPRTSPPALGVSAARVKPGESVTVTLSNGYGDGGDWLTLSATTAPNGSYVQYIYVGAGVTTRTWTVAMPATAGTYEFRLYLKNSYTRGATSPVVTVSP